MLINMIPPQNKLRDAITDLYRKDETTCINALLKQAQLPEASLERIQETAAKLVIGTRERRKKTSKLDSFLNQYDLSSEEGIALMCLAEALLRIPDTSNIDKLISDKISTANWSEHKSSDSMFLNAATWSLILTGKIFSETNQREKSLTHTLKKLISRVGSSMIRPIVIQGMKIMGQQFVMGRTIEEAVERAKKYEAQGYRYSYDMLGEAARTDADAEVYFRAYEKAIAAIGSISKNLNHIEAPGVSVKLSALHPRYEYSQRDRVLKELVPRLLALAEQAKAENIGLTVDAEEADRLELSLDVIEAVFSNPNLAGWEGFGLAVQSYQKRAPAVLDWLIDLSHKHHKKIMVRLIKGAYWDAEIKQSQVLGLEGYPVFTRKNATDVSFIACAKKILAHPDVFYAQFGTHNAYSVAAILEMTQGRTDFEFQCLHGMGQPLYDQIVGKKNLNISCRIYAPVGSHKDLLGYLVRRLLENGANTSFINRLADENIPIEKIIADPVKRMESLAIKPHPYIPLPRDIYGSSRENSEGIDLTNVHHLSHLKRMMDKYEKEQNNYPHFDQDSIAIVSPANPKIVVGHVNFSSKEEVEKALDAADKATIDWAKTTISERATILEEAANLFEENLPKLMTLLVREGGKQIVDCVSEVREAVDFCRYYASRARKDLIPHILSGPTGEFNELSLHPRGTIACISPWNFPLAIFIGQVVAALAAGNTVIAKPAEQTPLIALEAVRILKEAGIPKNVLQLVLGNGSVIGPQLTSDERVKAVMFTGSTETAKLIQQSLSERPGAIVPLIAETGGQNAMIVDSTALPEQVVMDILQSTYNSAGQRCSALRVLFLQNEIADRVITMLQGAMKELSIGDPAFLTTDVGPVIDTEARTMLQKHFDFMCQEGILHYQVQLPPSLQGYFFAPCLFEIKDLSILKREIFGPILHVIRYSNKQLDQVLEAIKNTGYGLTLGIHSRIDATVDYIKQQMPVGNIYVNRNMIGAVVGVQPFGGEHLSGTGPKAGGPYYLPRLCVERCISINNTAAGGNATLVSLAEDD